MASRDEPSRDLRAEAFSMYITIELIVALVLVIFVVAPLLVSESKQGGVVPIDVTPASDLKHRRLVVYENIQDLDFEYKAGKMAPDDYESLRESYMAEAAHLMLASQEAERPRSAVDSFIEREVAARRAHHQAQPVEEYTCSKCGFENPVPVKFCGNCGASVVASAKRK